MLPASWLRLAAQKGSTVAMNDELTQRPAPTNPECQDAGVDVALFVKALGGFFAIMNPFVSLPMFLTLTSGDDLRRQRATAVRVALYSLIMAVVIMLSGTAILSFFGISVNHFRVAGGLVLGMIGLGMLNGGSDAHDGTPHEKARMRAKAAHPSAGIDLERTPGSASDRTSDAVGDVSFYPLTFPMLLGPGTITALIVFTGQAKDVPGVTAIVAALLIVLAILFVVLWFAPAIGNRMSQTLRGIMTRLMGMIIAAIAVAMVIDGLQALIPALR